MFSVKHFFRKFSRSTIQDSIHPLVYEIETIIKEIVQTTVSRSWDENHISYTLMERMQCLFNNKKVDFPGWSKVVNWESFKNSGIQETKYGDIALLVNIQFSDGAILKGVACLEAKRSYENNNFQALHSMQITNINNEAPHSQLLLYTHYNPRIPLKFPRTIDWDSYMWVTSTNAAKQLLPQLGNENKRMLRISFPFSMFLMSRILWGQDLDYRSNIYDDIQKGISKKDIFRPAFLGVVNVYYDRQQPIQTNVSDIWNRI